MSKKKREEGLSRDTFPNLALFVLISVFFDWTFNHALYNIPSKIELMKLLVGKLVVWLLLKKKKKLTSCMVKVKSNIRYIVVSCKLIFIFLDVRGVKRIIHRIIRKLIPVAGYN